MIKIYGLLTPNVLKPILAAEELSIAYQHINIDLPKREHKSPEYLQKHPFGMVPLLEDEGRYLWESNAIVRYLASVAETPLYPREAWQRGQVEQWLEFAAHEVGRYTTGIFFQKCVASQVFKLPVNENKIQEFSGRLQNEMPILDKHLEKNPYLAGKQYSIADIVLFSLTSPYRVAGLELQKYTHFANWFQSIKDRPAVQKLIPKLPMPYMS